jgi:hypothetical protein
LAKIIDCGAGKLSPRLKTTLFHAWFVRIADAKRRAVYLNALRTLRPHVLQRYLHRGNVIFWLGQ